jgi:hypothetical protein
VAFLISRNRNRSEVYAVTNLALAGAFTALRIENVAENSEQPGAQTCSWLKFLRIGPCAQQGLLDEVISVRHGSAERNCERPQTRNLSTQIVLKAAVTHRALERDLRGLDVLCVLHGIIPLSEGARGNWLCSSS